MKSCTDEQTEYMISMFEESTRLHGLSNRELVIECLNMSETDPVVEEMMNRLFPEWETGISDGEMLGH
jgi:hypothetical protein